MRYLQHGVDDVLHISLEVESFIEQEEFYLLCFSLARLHSPDEAQAKLICQDSGWGLQSFRYQEQSRQQREKLVNTCHHRTVKA